MTMPQGPSGLNPDAWLQEWVIKAGESGNSNTTQVVIPAASGASGATGDVFVPIGASGYTNLVGASGASGATGASGVTVTVANTASFPSLHQREQGVVQALLRDSVPILGAWQGAQDAFANILLGGFTSVENFIEVLFKILTGQEIDLSFISDGAREILELLGAVFGPIGNLFEWLWENIGEDILREILGFLGWVWNEFGSTASEILQAIFGFLKWMFDLFGDVIDSVLQPIFEFLKDVFERFDVDGFLKPVIDLVFGFWDTVGGPVLGTIGQLIIDIFDAVPEWIIRSFFDTVKTVWTVLDTVFIENIVQLLVNLSDNDDVFDIIEDVVSFFRGVIEDAGSIIAGIPLVGDVVALIGQGVQGAIDTVTDWFFSLLSAFNANVVIETIAEGIRQVVQFLSNLPVIGSIISFFVPDEWKNTVGRPASSMADLKEYSAELLNTSSVLNTANLQGEIPADLLPVVSPGLVGDTVPNLIADAGFKSAASVQAGSGWSWDAAVSRTSTDGGSAKVAGDGGVKQMFSNLVAVSPGQSIECAVWARWTKPSAARPTVSVGLRGYNNDAVVFTQAVGQRSSIVANSASTSGNVNGWVQLSGTYDIPATQNLTHVRLVLSVLNAPTGTLVWFDEASLRKVSLIKQELIAGVSPGSNLADDIENAVGADQYQALLDRVAKKTGATLADVQATVDDFLDGDSTISGDQIRAGNIASAYINELSQTWGTVQKGTGGPTATASNTLAGAFAALDSWRIANTENGSKILAVEGQANAATKQVSDLRLEYDKLLRYAGEVAAEARRAVIQVGLTPTVSPTPPSVAPPTFASVRDEFNRTSVGSNWSVGQRISNYGGLTVDGRNAVLSMPDGDLGDFFQARFNVYAAIYSGGINSLTNYQRVYMMLGSAPGRPLIGESGFNDLIGRARSSTVCVVARFYNDLARTVKLFWRNGSYETNSFAPTNEFASFSRPAGELTASTSLEFFIGDRSVSDATQCYVKIGNWTSAKYKFNASQLSLLGSGWGFGGGNGRSGGAVQKPGVIDSWGAEDQV